MFVQSLMEGRGASIAEKNEIHDEVGWGKGSQWIEVVKIPRNFIQVENRLQRGTRLKLRTCCNNHRLYLRNKQ